LKVGASFFGRVLWLTGSDETGSYKCVRVLLVDLKDIPTAPPGLGSSWEDAGQLLDFLLVILAAILTCSRAGTWWWYLYSHLSGTGVVVGEPS